MKRKCTLISVAMTTLVLVSLCTVCASISVSAAVSSSANIQSALVGAPAGVAGAPAVCKPYVNGGYIALFVRGNDGALWWESWDGTWSGWTSLGAPAGGLTSDPAVTTPDYNYMTVSVRGTDGALWVIETSDGGNSWGVGILGADRFSQARGRPYVAGLLCPARLAQITTPGLSLAQTMRCGGGKPRVTGMASADILLRRPQLQHCLPYRSRTNQSTSARVAATAPSG
jgi:hypothetical protein